jgi:hypothetical protein
LRSFTPRIRVEVYVPITYQQSYQNLLTWVIDEFTQLRGGCTVNENVGGYYLSRANEVINDRVSVVYSDFPMNWYKKADRAEVLGYCTGLKQFLFQNLWEEEILIAAYPVSHFAESTHRHAILHNS